MNTLNFKAPKIAEPSDVSAMVASFVAKHGVRRFDRGFSQDWLYLQNLMLSFGYVLRKERKFYVLTPLNYRGRLKLLGRDAVLSGIDDILVANGKQPFIRRAAA